MLKRKLLLIMLFMPFIAWAQKDSTQAVTWTIPSCSDSYPRVNFNYWSVDEKGEPILLSAQMMWNNKTSENKQENVILYCPYSHCAGYECATGNGGITSQAEQNLGIWSSNWFILPDGEGFGVSESRTQMYLNHEVWARQEVDCLRAAWNARQQLIDAGEKYPLLSDDWHTIICGASQGGGTALATLRYMEEENANPTTDTVAVIGKSLGEEALADYYRVSFANVCNGVYNPAETIKAYFQSWYETSYPCAIPMLLKTMILSYPDIMKDVKEEDFYTQEYLDVKPEVDAALSGKQMTSTEINEIFGKNFSHNLSFDITKLGYRNGIYVTEFIRPDVLDFSSPAIKKLMQCLERNNVLRDGWKPKHFIKLEYSRNDDIIPCSNSKELLNELEPGNYSARDSGLGHVQGCTNWILSSWTEKEF